MARKRHLASSARGFYGFCLAPTTKLIRSIRLIRGRISQQRWDFPGAPEFLSLLLERPNQGGGHAGQREDYAAYLEHTVLAITVLLLGLHIYDVVLLQIEAGRAEDIRVAYVVYILPTLTVALADDRHLVELGIGSGV